MNGLAESSLGFMTYLHKTVSCQALSLIFHTKWLPWFKILFDESTIFELVHPLLNFDRELYSRVLLWCQILKRQLSHQMFVRKLLIFSSLFRLSNLKYIWNKCFEDKSKSKCHNDFCGKLFLKSWYTSVYILCFHCWDLFDEHLTW